MCLEPNYGEGKNGKANDYKELLEQVVVVYMIGEYCLPVYLVLKYEHVGGLQSYNSRCQTIAK